MPPFGGHGRANGRLPKFQMTKQGLSNSHCMFVRLRRSMPRSQTNANIRNFVNSVFPSGTSNDPKLQTSNIFRHAFPTPTVGTPSPCKKKGTHFSVWSGRVFTGCSLYWAVSDTSFQNLDTIPPLGKNRAKNTLGKCSYNDENNSSGKESFGSSKCSACPGTV